MGLDLENVRLDIPVFTTDMRSLKESLILSVSWAYWKILSVMQDLGSFYGFEMYMNFGRYRIHTISMTAHFNKELLLPLSITLHKRQERLQLPLLQVDGWR